MYPKSQAQQLFSAPFLTDHTRKDADSARSRKLSSNCSTNIPDFSNEILCYSIRTKRNCYLYFTSSNKAAPNFKIELKQDSFNIGIDCHTAVCGRATTYTSKVKKSMLSVNKSNFAKGDTIFGYFYCEFDRIPEFNQYQMDNDTYNISMHFASVVEGGK